MACGTLASYWQATVGKLWGLTMSDTRFFRKATFALIGAGFVSGHGAQAQFFQGRESAVQGESLRGQAQFLRGMTWYELGAA